METLIFWIGALVGLFLGMLLYSLLDMAQKADKLNDQLEPGRVRATSMDISYLPASEIRLPASRQTKLPRGDWQDQRQRVGHK